MKWYGMVWYGMVWYGMVWYGMVWYGMHCTFVGVYVDMLVGVLVVIMTAIAMDAVLLRVVTHAAIYWCITLGTIFRRHHV